MSFPQPFAATTPLLRDIDVPEDEEAASTPGVLSASLSLFNVLVGSGLLALPAAFAASGIAAAWVSLILLSSLSGFTSLLLQRARVALAKDGILAADYVALAGAALGARSQVLVKVSLALAQSGFAASYFVFVARDVLDLWAGPHDRKVPLSVSAVVFLLGCLGVVLQLPRSINKLTWLGWVNLGALALCVSALCVDGVHRLRAEGRVLHAPWSPAYGPLILVPTYADSFGIIAFSYACQAVVLPLATSLVAPCADPAAALPKLRRVVLLSNAAATALYMAVGTLGVMFYGRGVAAVLSDELRWNVAGYGVRVALALVCLSALPLQLYPVVEIAVAALQPRLGPDAGAKGVARHNALRVIVVLGPALVAAVLPCFEQVTNLVGAVCTSTVAFLLPPAIFVAQARKRDALTRCDALVCAACASIGLVGAVSCTILTIRQLARGMCS